MSTGLTTRFGLPFPYGDDPLVNGDDMIQRLAEAVDALAYERGVLSQRLYLTSLYSPQQLVQPDVWTYPKGPYTLGVGPDYGGIVLDVPNVDTTNGFIYIPETGFYEIEWRQTYYPSAAGVSDTNQMWVAAWRDNNLRGRDDFMRGHRASEVVGTGDPAMNGGSILVPFLAGQSVRSAVLIRGGVQSVSTQIRVCGPVGRPMANI